MNNPTILRPPDDATIGTTQTSQTMLDGLKVLNPEAWNAFLQIFWPRILHKAKMAGLTEEEALDFAQETMFRSIKGLPRFRRKREGSFRAWINTIMGCRLIDHWRRHYRAKARVIPLCDAKSGRPLLDQVPAAASAQPDIQFETNARLKL